MSTHDWKEVEELLHQAMALAPEQRAEFLGAACGSDAALRAELNSLLLVGDDLSDEFLNSPLRGVLDPEIGEIDSASALVAGQILPAPRLAFNKSSKQDNCCLYRKA